MTESQAVSIFIIFVGAGLIFVGVYTLVNS